MASKLKDSWGEGFFRFISTFYWHSQLHPSLSWERILQSKTKSNNVIYWKLREGYVGDDFPLPALFHAEHIGLRNHLRTVVSYPNQCIWLVIGYRLSKPTHPILKCFYFQGEMWQNNSHFEWLQRDISCETRAPYQTSLSTG